MNFRATRGDHRGVTWVVVLVFVLFGWSSRSSAEPLTNSAAFFNDLSSRLIRKQFGVGLRGIQIQPTNNYTPAIHRLLQVAANVWEAKTGSADGFPTCFYPRFVATNGAVFLTDYGVATNNSQLGVVVDLAQTTNLYSIVATNSDVILLGVPPILGVRKGFPNFNEFGAEVLVSMARKIQVVKSGAAITQTNQSFTFGVKIPIGAEFWNSYATNFPEPVSIFVTNFTSVRITNDLGVDYRQMFVTGDQLLNTNNWRGYFGFSTRDSRSFITLLKTNLPALMPSGYSPSLGAAGFFPTNQNIWDTSQQLIMPRWGLSVGHGLQAMIVNTNGRVLDHVALSGMTFQTNLTDVIGDWTSLSDAALVDSGATPPAFKQLWVTNQLGDGLLSGRFGVVQQINISLGAIPRTGNWLSYGQFSPGSPAAAASAFVNFMFVANTNGVMTAPFTPMAVFRIPFSWQANDPLVHGLSAELYDASRSAFVELLKPEEWVNASMPLNLGALNVRYKPWPVDITSQSMDAYSADIKDPLVRTSDDWRFPRPTTFSLAQLGLIHRGTPWQTLYLKASDMGRTNGVFALPEWLTDMTVTGPAMRWSSWSPNETLVSGYQTRPVRDRSLLATIVAAVTAVDPRQQFSINTRDESLWKQLFAGMAALTNVATSQPIYEDALINPNSTQAQALVTGIAAARGQMSGAVFRSLGDLFSAPILTDSSPWLNRSTTSIQRLTITEEASESLPAQLLSQVREDSDGAPLAVMGNGFSIRFTGVDNFAYAVELSTNLTTWTAVSTNFPTDGVFDYPVSPQTQMEYFRSVLLP